MFRRLYPEIVILFVVFLFVSSQFCLAAEPSSLKPFIAGDRSFHISIPNKWEIYPYDEPGTYIFSPKDLPPFLVVTAIRYPTTKIWDKLTGKESLVAGYKNSFTRLLVNIFPMDVEILSEYSTMEIQGPRQFGGNIKARRNQRLIGFDITYKLEDYGMYSLCFAAYEDTYKESSVLFGKMSKSFKPNSTVFQIPLTLKEIEEDLNRTVAGMAPSFPYAWRYNVKNVSISQSEGTTVPYISLQFESSQAKLVIEEFSRILPYVKNGQNPPFQPRCKPDAIYGFTQVFFQIIGVAVNRSVSSGAEIGKLVFILKAGTGETIQQIAILDVEGILPSILSDDAQKLFSTMVLE
jgi:hypothetical protein